MAVHGTTTHRSRVKRDQSLGSPHDSKVVDKSILPFTGSRVDPHHTPDRVRDLFLLELENDSSDFDAAEYERFNVVVRSASYKTIEINEPSITTTYNIKGRHGRSFGEFEVKEPGAHKILSWYKGKDGPYVIIAVKKDLTSIEILLFTAGIIVSVLCGIFGVVWLLRTQSKRKRI